MEITGKDSLIEVFPGVQKKRFKDALELLNVNPDACSLEIQSMRPATLPSGRSTLQVQMYGDEQLSLDVYTPGKPTAYRCVLRFSQDAGIIIADFQKKLVRIWKEMEGLVASTSQPVPAVTSAAASRASVLNGHTRDTEKLKLRGLAGRPHDVKRVLDTVREAGDEPISRKDLAQILKSLTGGTKGVTFTVDALIRRGYFLTSGAGLYVPLPEGQMPVEHTGTHDADDPVSSRLTGVNALLEGHFKSKAEIFAKKEKIRHLKDRADKYLDQIKQLEGEITSSQERLLSEEDLETVDDFLRRMQNRIPVPGSRSDT